MEPAPPKVLVAVDPLEPATTAMVFITQEVYFLGFPFGQSGGDFIPTFGTHPVPIGKHGILSALNDGVLLVDAYNNPGFSGGPIVFRDLSHNGPPAFYVLGVVAGFYPDLVSVTSPTPIQPYEDLSKIEPWRIQEVDRKKVVFLDTPQKVPLNSGILIGYGIDYALKTIREHPIGPEVPKTIR